MLTVYNIHSQNLLNLPTSGTKVYYLMYFRNTFQYANEVQSNDTRYATPKNYVSHV